MEITSLSAVDMIAASRPTPSSSSGGITGDVLNEGTLIFHRADAVTFARAIGGTGAVQQRGTGTLTLAGENTYSGQTTITAGTLEFTGPTAGLGRSIVNEAVLIFNQAADGSFAGVISGTGNVTKEGAGSLTLTGANTYGGGTMVNGGTLQGDTTSLQGDIVNRATVRFDQAATGTYARLMD